MDQAIVDKLERKLQKAIADVVVKRSGLKYLPLMPTSGYTAVILCLAASVALAADVGRSNGGRSNGQFIIGADISWVQQQEDAGTRFSDRGVKKDIFVILKEHKFNWIRLRLFNDPKAAKGYSRKGYCDLAHTLQMVKRIKGAGMGFLLDFHYSDNWADPGHQSKPAAWKDLHAKELQAAVREYTREVVAALKKQGTPPDMVQIGNEISNGFLWPDGQVSQTKDWANRQEADRAGPPCSRKMAVPSPILRYTRRLPSDLRQSRPPDLSFQDEIVRSAS